MNGADRFKTVLFFATVLAGAALLTFMIGGATITGLLAAPGYDTQDPRQAAIAADTEERFSTDDTVELIIRFDDPGPDQGPAVDQLPDGTVDIDALQERQEQAQQAFSQFAAETSGVTVDRSFWLGNSARVTVDTDRVGPSDLARVQNVAHVAPDRRVTILSSEDHGGAAITQTGTASFNGGYDAEWGIDRVNATVVWDTFGTRGNNTKVAVLDTGVNSSHPDLDLYTDDPADDTYPGGWAEFDEDGNEVDGSEPHDTHGHGTHVSGTVTGGNSSGNYIGVAPDADLMHGLVLPEGVGTGAQVIAGMEWAVENGADVISMSLGNDGYSSGYIDPIQDAEAAGVTVISAIGNEDPDTSSSPGNVYNGSSIGATDMDNAVSGFSSGEVINTDDAWSGDAPASWPDQYVTPDLSAPGVSITSSTVSGGWGSSDGTSMATPHVAGIAAILQSGSNWHMPPDTIKHTLIRTAWKPDDDTWEDSIADWESETGKTWTEPKSERDPRYGYGIVDVYAAYTHLKLDRDRLWTCDTYTGANDWILNESVTDPGTCLTFNGTHTLDGDSRTVTGGIATTNGSTAITNLTVDGADTGVLTRENTTTNLSHITFTENVWDVSSPGVTNASGIDLDGQGLAFTGTRFNLSSGEPVALPENQTNVSAFMDVVSLDEDAWLDLALDYSTDDLLVNESNITLWRHDGVEWSTVADTVRNEAGQTAEANLSTFSTVVAAGNEVTPANVTVNLTAAPATVVDGQTWNVSVTAENTGEKTAEQNITAVVGNTTNTDGEAVTLEYGDSVGLNLTLQHNVTGNTTVNVSSDNSHDATNITVLPEPNVTLTVPVDGQVLDYSDNPVGFATQISAAEPVNATTRGNGTIVNSTVLSGNQNWLNASVYRDPGLHHWNTSIHGNETGYTAVSDTYLLNVTAPYVSIEDRTPDNGSTIGYPNRDPAVFTADIGTNMNGTMTTWINGSNRSQAFDGSTQLAFEENLTVPGNYSWNMSAVTANATDTSGWYVVTVDQPQATFSSSISGSTVEPGTIDIPVTVDAEESGNLTVTVDGSTFERNLSSGEEEYVFENELDEGSYTVQANTSILWNATSSATFTFDVEDADDDDSSTSTFGSTRRDHENDTGADTDASDRSPRVTETTNLTRFDSLYLDAGETLNHSFDQFQPISAVTFTAPDTLENASIRVTRDLAQMADDTGTAVHDGFTVDTDVPVNATFTFSVNETWFRDTGVHPANVSLYRVSDPATSESWTRVNTLLLDEAPYRYRADTALSTFVIAGERTPVDATDGKDCLTFPGSYSIPATGNWTMVEDCDTWREQTRLKKMIDEKHRRALSEGESEALAEAESYLEQGDLDTARSLLDDVEQKRDTRDGEQDTAPKDDGRAPLLLALAAVFAAIILSYRLYVYRRSAKAWEAEQ